MDLVQKQGMTAITDKGGKLVLEFFFFNFADD